MKRRWTIRKTIMRWKVASTSISKTNFGEKPCVSKLQLCPNWKWSNFPREPNYTICHYREFTLDGLDSVALQHMTNNNIFSCLAKSNPVKLEPNRTMILPLWSCMSEFFWLTIIEQRLKAYIPSTKSMLIQIIYLVEISPTFVIRLLKERK